MRDLKNKKLVVFFDFDKTITKIDVIDDILERFSVDDAWKDLEKRWLKKEIGSRECLDGQMKCVRISKAKLNRYLDKVKIDPYFGKLLSFLKAKKAKTLIVSDDFDHVIKRILKNSGIGKIGIFCNTLRFSGDRLRTYFTNGNHHCRLCAHCKKLTVTKHSGGDIVTLYVGDGLSDACASEHVDLVFAKEHLLKYCKQKGINYIRYNGLKDVYDYIKKGLS